MRYFLLRKNILLLLSSLEESSVTLEAGATVNTSPAPSQSDEVRMGGCVWVKWFSAKNRVKAATASERIFSKAALMGVLGRKWGIVRRYSGV